MKPRTSNVARFMSGVLSNFNRKPTTVNVVDCSRRPLTQEEMAEYVYGETPTVLKGLVNHFPMNRWSIDYFGHLDNGETSPIVSIARNTVEQSASVMEDMPLRDFFAYLESMNTDEGEDIPTCSSSEVPPLIDPKKYMYCNEEQALITTHFPVLWEELQHIRQIYPKRLIQEYSLWIGPKGSVTGLHADHDYNSLVQCQGRKTMIFIPRDEEDLVYPSKKFDPGASLSYVDLRCPKHNQIHYPNLQHATPSLAYLEPGDVICIPRKWYHFVVCTEGPSLSVTLHCNSVGMKAREVLQKVGHYFGIHGWTEDGCTCHNADGGRR
jgi:hypothetical protein